MCPQDGVGEGFQDCVQQGVQGNVGITEGVNLGVLKDIIECPRAFPKRCQVGVQRLRE